MTHHTSPRAGHAATTRGSVHRTDPAGRFCVEAPPGGIQRPAVSSRRANSVEAALATDRALEVFCDEDAADRFSALIDTARGRGVRLHGDRAGDAVLADTVTPSGIVALCRTLVVESGHDPADTAGSHPARLVAIGQALAEPGNVGTLIRVSDALGADAVWSIEARGSREPCGPRVRGESFPSTGRAGHRRVGAAGCARLRQWLQIAVATADGEVDIEHADEILSRPTAWVFGNEAHGVPARWPRPPTCGSAFRSAGERRA